MSTARFIAELIICQHHQAILGTTSPYVCDVLVLQDLMSPRPHTVYIPPYNSVLKLPYTKEVLIMKLKHNGHNI